MFLDFLYSLSSDKSDSLDDEPDDNGSDSGSSCTCSFPLYFDDYVGRVSGLGYGGFIPTVVNSKCDIFDFVVFVPIGVNSKVFFLKFLFFTPNSKISFIIIVMV